LPQPPCHDRRLPSTPVDFYFAAMSPYSWLAAERIDELLPSARWRPVTAAFIFKAAGRTSWGLTEQRAGGIADSERRAEQYGLAPIRWPDPWPTSDVDVARAMIWAGHRDALKAYALAAMRLCFREARVLSEPATLTEAAARCGLDGDQLLAAIGDSAIKAELRAATDAASARGVFGVPTFAVGEALLWGDDRLEEAAGMS
jgi:2-hydroxychromene-2-carboxylate isomerase